MSGSYLKQIHISNDGRYKITTTMAYVYEKPDLNYMSNGTKFYFKKVRTKRTRLEKDQTNYIHQKKQKETASYLRVISIPGLKEKYM